MKFLPREKLRELSLNPSWDDSQIPAWVTCVTRYVEPLFRNASKVSPLPVAYTHTVTTPGPSLHCQPSNTTIDSFFSFSFLFFPTFFFLLSSASLTYGSGNIEDRRTQCDVIGSHRMLRIGRFPWFVNLSSLTRESSEFLYRF